MEKKKYLKPSMQVIDLPNAPQLLLIYSNGNMNYIPGQPVDEKHLA